MTPHLFVKREESACKLTREAGEYILSVNDGGLQIGAGARQDCIVILQDLHCAFGSWLKLSFLVTFPDFLDQQGTHQHLAE